jgi:hypothetical protein
MPNPVIYANGEVRLQVSGKLWHKVTLAGPEFKCKCSQRIHIISWFEDIPLLLRILAYHRDEEWNVLCDGERMLLALPLAGYKGKHHITRLVGVIWPTDGILTFVS